MIFAECTNGWFGTLIWKVGHDILGGALLKILLYIPDVGIHLSYGVMAWSCVYFRKTAEFRSHSDTFGEICAKFVFGPDKHRLFIVLFITL